jgi:uncharacterized membrane protein
MINLLVIVISSASLSDTVISRIKYFIINRTQVASSTSSLIALYGIITSIVSSSGGGGGGGGG